MEANLGRQLGTSGNRFGPLHRMRRVRDLLSYRSCRDEPWAPPDRPHHGLQPIVVSVNKHVRKVRSDWATKSFCPR